MQWLLSVVLLAFLQVTPAPTPEAAVNPQSVQSSPGDGAITTAPPNENQPHSLSIDKLPPVTVVPQKRDLADWGYWAFSALLVVVGGLQVWLLSRTLGAIKKQGDLIERQVKSTEDAVTAARDNAQAAKDNAEAAKANAEAAKTSVETLMNSERAWVDVRLEWKGPAIYHLQFTNFGRTVAKIKGWKLETRIYLFGEQLPAAEKIFDNSNLSPHAKLLPPSGTPWHAERLDLAARLGDDMVRKLSGQEIHLAYWGILAYDDISDKPHLTYFCYCYNAATQSLEPVEDPEYNEHT
jgi:hypothetical protein